MEAIAAKNDELNSIQQAAYDTIHCTPGKANVIAPVLGKAPHSLLNEVNPNIPTHKFGLLDAAKVMEATGDYSMLHALSSYLHHSSIFLGDYAAICDTELLEAYAEFHRRVGDKARAVAKALADRVVTKAEVLEIKHTGDEMIRTYFEFIARLEAIAE